MKKYLIIAASVIAMFALTACGETENAGKVSEESKITAENEKTEGSSSEEDTAAEVPEETEAEKASGDPGEAIPGFSFPTELTDNLYDCRVKVGDKVYCVPCTLKAFLDEGFAESSGSTSVTLESATDGIITSFSSNFSNSEAGSYISVDYRNTSAEKINALSEEGSAVCLVTSLMCNEQFNKVSIELPKSIKAGESTKDDVIAAYGEPKEIENNDTFIYYEGDKAEDYKELSKYISLRFDGDTLKWAVLKSKE